MDELPRFAITANTAFRLATLFGVSETFWMYLQTDYDLEIAMIICLISLSQHPNLPYSKPAAHMAVLGKGLMKNMKFSIQRGTEH